MIKIKPRARHKARRFALQALYQWQLSGNDLNAIEQQFLEREDVDLTKVDMPYFQELIHRIPASIDVLDAAFQSFLDRPLDEIGAVELAILRIGSYELQEHPEIPYRVILNEAIELAKAFGAEDSHKYVNAILNGASLSIRASERDEQK